MALKKSQLYSSLWSSCDELRGGMDASQYKDYVLVLLFIKYVSDKYAGVPYATGMLYVTRTDYDKNRNRRHIAFVSIRYHSVYIYCLTRYF